MEFAFPTSSFTKFLLNLFIAVLYFFAARFSLHLAFEQTNATPVWPPSGIAFAAILLFGRKLSPGILVGAFTVNLYTLISNNTCDNLTAAWVSALIAIGNTAEALTGYFLIKKMTVAREIFRKVRTVFQFAFVAVIMSMVSSTIGSTADLLGGIISLADYSTVWFTWWSGDFAGILTVTPFILIWIFPADPKWKRELVVEKIAFIILIIFLTGIIFDEWLWLGFLFTRAFLIIPLLLWAAFRFQQRIVITTIVFCSAIATVGTLHGHGPLLASTFNESLLTMQAFVCVIALSVMALNAAILEYRNAEKELRELSSELEKRVQERTVELQKSHELLMEAQRLARIGSWEWHIPSNKITWTEELFNIFGIIPGEMTPDYESYRNLLHPDERDEIDSIIRRSLADGKPFSFYHRVVRKDGETRIIHAHGEALRDKDGSVYKLSGTAQDVTERKAAEELLNKTSLQLEQKNKELERSNQELSSFSYVAGHDLQEPLRKIRYFSERIRENDHLHLSETGVNYFLRMETAATRMQNLIDDLLTYSQVDVIEKNYADTDINVLLEEVKSELSETIHNKQATIESTPLLNCRVIAFQFRQLLTNLITNSLKFSKPDLPSVIKLSADIRNGTGHREFPGDKGKRYYHLTVSDNGIGFDKESSKKIFQIFHRLHGKYEYAGTGIGLAICKKIAENHQGYILAESEPGKGSAFHVYIPV
jgi:PAS domain S-box-containing protein